MKYKSLLFHSFKIAVSIAALLLISNSLDIGKTLAAIKLAKIHLLVFSIIITFVEQIVIAHKWIILLKVKNFTISLWRLLTINLIAGFWGLFLPSSLSVDVLRGFYLYKNDSGKVLSASTIIVDRIMGILSLLFVTVIGILISDDLLSKFNVKTYVVILSILVIGICTLIFNFQIYNYITQFLLSKKNSFFSKIVDLYKVIFEFKGYPFILVKSFFWSVFVQVLRIIAIYLISEAYQLDIGIIYFFILVPITMLTIMIPISVGGIGVREGSFIAFFSLVGLSFNDAVLISLTTTLKVVLFSLFGGFLYLFYKPAGEIKK